MNSSASGNKAEGKEALSAPGYESQKQEIKLLLQEERKDGDTMYEV